jgi:hypothetical protein
LLRMRWRFVVTLPVAPFSMPSLTWIVTSSFR